MKKLYILLICFITGCATTVNQKYNKSDLNPAAIEAFNQNQNSLYKIKPEYATDASVALVRMDVLSAYSTKNFGEIIMSLWLQDKENFFNCEEFYSKLTQAQIKKVESKMENHPFLCKDPNYEIDNALLSFKHILTKDINTPSATDSHWAWYSATGNSEALKNILDNYLSNSKACDCIPWSFLSNVAQNDDVKKYLVEYRQDKTDSEKAMLNMLLPLDEYINVEQTKIETKSYDEIEKQIEILNSVIGRWPPKFKNEEEKIQVKLYWHNVLWDAKVYYSKNGETSQSMFLLAELYRQGHNMDMNGSGDLANDFIEDCLNKFSNSVDCNRSAIFFYLSIHPKFAPKAKKSLDFLRNHYKPKYSEEAERGHIFYYVLLQNHTSALKQIEKYLEIFPDSKERQGVLELKDSILTGDIRTHIE